MYLGMIDLETISTRPDAAMVALALVLVEVDGPVTRHLARDWVERVDLSLALGHEDKETLKWWTEQEADVQDFVFGGNLTSTEVLQDMNKWIKSIVRDPADDTQLQMYADPATFDFPILKMQYAYANVPMVWTYRQENCLGQVKRTLKKMGLTIPEIQSTKPHHPLYDCQAQMDELIECQALIRQAGRT